MHFTAYATVHNAVPGAFQSVWHHGASMCKKSAQSAQEVWHLRQQQKLPDVAGEKASWVPDPYKGNSKTDSFAVNSLLCKFL